MVRFHWRLWAHWAYNQLDRAVDFSSYTDPKATLPGVYFVSITSRIYQHTLSSPRYSMDPYFLCEKSSFDTVSVTFFSVPSARALWLLFLCCLLFGSKTLSAIGIKTINYVTSWWLLREREKGGERQTDRACLRKMIISIWLSQAAQHFHPLFTESNTIRLLIAKKSMPSKGISICSTSRNVVTKPSLEQIASGNRQELSSSNLRCLHSSPPGLPAR